jgi:hypothetical protein
MRDNAVISEYIKTFIANSFFNNKQERARQKLLPISRNEWEEASSKLVTWLDFKKVVKLTPQEAAPNSLREKYGNKAGIYLDFSSEPKSMTLSEAAAIHFKDALFILEQGNLVFFFTRDDEVYVCKKS